MVRKARDARHQLQLRATAPPSTLNGDFEPRIPFRVRSRTLFNLLLVTLMTLKTHFYPVGLPPSHVFQLRAVCV